MAQQLGITPPTVSSKQVERAICPLLQPVRSLRTRQVSVMSGVVLVRQTEVSISETQGAASKSSVDTDEIRPRVTSIPPPKLVEVPRAPTRLTRPTSGL